MRLAFACVTIVMALWSSISAAAAADAPERTDAFIAYCKNNSEGCVDRVTDTWLVIMVTPGRGGPRLCFTKESHDLKILTSMVVQWLSGHPELGNKSTDDGIRAAFLGLFPCA